jgi:hypothetical protein
MYSQPQKIQGQILNECALARANYATAPGQAGTRYRDNSLRAGHANDRMDRLAPRCEAKDKYATPRGSVG